MALPAFTEDFRYSKFPLTPDSVVIDVGVHEGNFAKILAEKYPGIKIIGFEPIGEFFDVADTVLEPFENIHLYAYALGAKPANDVPWQLHGCMTGILSDGEKTELVTIRSAQYELEDLAPQGCDLLKLNVENSEYEILECLLDCGYLKLVKAIQCQWHAGVKDFEKRRAAIELALENLGFKRIWERGDYNVGWDGFSKT